MTARADAHFGHLGHLSLGGKRGAMKVSDNSLERVKEREVFDLTTLPSARAIALHGKGVVAREVR